MSVAEKDLQQRFDFGFSSRNHWDLTRSPHCLRTALFTLKPTAVGKRPLVAGTYTRKQPSQWDLVLTYLGLSNRATTS